MKKKFLSLILFLSIVTFFTGCETNNNTNNLDDLLNQDKGNSKVYTKIECEQDTYIDTKYYLYVKSGKYIANIEFDEETASVYSYTLNLEITMENSSTNDTLKDHAEKFNDYCNENNNGTFKSCTYRNYLEGTKKTVITGEYDLSKIQNLPTSASAAKTFLETRHGMTCTIK